MKMNEAELVKMARDWADDFWELSGNLEEKDLTDLAKSAGAMGFFVAYNIAQAIVEEELQAVQAQRGERPGLGSAEYALKNVLSKMGGK